MTRAEGTAWPRTASSSTIVGDLPPNSRVMRFMVSAPSRMIDLPTPTEPVKEILSTSGLRTSSAPTTLPRPVTTFRSAEDAARLSHNNGGVTGYLEVLTNETNAFSTELGLVQAQLNELLALVQLYQALGGGWQQQP